MISTENQAFVLDLTRLISRVGTGVFTGVDRVELAYFRYILNTPKPCFFLIKTGKGYLLLDRHGGLNILPKILGEQSWGTPDIMSVISRALHPFRRRAEADLRRLAIDRALPPNLGNIFRRQKLENFTYLNTGHSNLIPRTLNAVKRQKGTKTAVFIHDTIPLDHHEYQTTQSTLRFEKLMQSVQEFADLIIYNSKQSFDDGTRYFGEGRQPKGIVAHLGVEAMPIQPNLLPKGLDYSRPYFLIVGTIEPRKNHQLLLDIWLDLANTFKPSEIPNLIIAGSRGWKNESFFRCLDDSQLLGNSIFEFQGLPDGAIGALTKNACAALFPSFAEGYGLPPAEAALLETPVICSDLAVHREILGDYPVYLGPDDAYSWKKEIIQRTVDFRGGQNVKKRAQKTAVLSSWEDHFEKVFHEQ